MPSMLLDTSYRLLWEDCIGALLDAGEALLLLLLIEESGLSPYLPTNGFMMGFLHNCRFVVMDRRVWMGSSGMVKVVAEVLSEGGHGVFEFGSGSEELFPVGLIMVMHFSKWTGKQSFGLDFAREVGWSGSAHLSCTRKARRLPGSELFNEGGLELDLLS